MKSQLKSLFIGVVFLTTPFYASAQTESGKVDVWVDCKSNWVFDGKADFAVTVSTEPTVEGDLQTTVYSMHREEIAKSSKHYKTNGDGTATVDFRFRLRPEFYTAVITCNGKEVKRLNFGVKPEKIISPRDAKADFWPFWEQTRRELADIEPQYRMTLKPELSGKLRDTYYVEMQSWGNVKIQGIYVVPKADGKYPVVVTYMGYGAKPWNINPDERGDIAEFVLSHRGQGLNESDNIYGDWITYNLNDRYNYYYRGAYMDAVRAVDFVESCSRTDKDCIVVDCGSQGGALAIVAAAFCPEVAGATIFSPFLSDYPDYFAIAEWPANVVRAKQHELGMSDEELFDTLSYFDVKNFAERVKCPTIMAIGVQDMTCPPHINFAVYNLLATKDKEWIAFPNRVHDVHAEPLWWQARRNYIDKIILKHHSK